MSAWRSTARRRPARTERTAGRSGVFRGAQHRERRRRSSARASTCRRCSTGSGSSSRWARTRTGRCRREWNAHGAAAFEFEVLDTLELPDDPGVRPARRPAPNCSRCGASGSPDRASDESSTRGPSAVCYNLAALSPRLGAAVGEYTRRPSHFDPRSSSMAEKKGFSADADKTELAERAVTDPKLLQEVIDALAGDDRRARQSAASVVHAIAEIEPGAAQAVRRRARRRAAPPRVADPLGGSRHVREARAGRRAPRRQGARRRRDGAARRGVRRGAPRGVSPAVRVRRDDRAPLGARVAAHRRGDPLLPRRRRVPRDAHERLSAW